MGAGDPEGRRCFERATETPSSSERYFASGAREGSSRAASAGEEEILAAKGDPGEEGLPELEDLQSLLSLPYSNSAHDLYS